MCLPCILVCLGEGAGSARAWEGFAWDVWHQISGAQRPQLSSPQAGKHELFPLLRVDDRAPDTIQTIAAWESKRDRILAVLGELIGQGTDLRPVPPYVDSLGQEDLDTYVRHHLRIATEPDDWIPAYLLVPKPVPTRPTPTMIVLHQTVPQGKEEPVGICMTHDIDFAVDLVQRGFVCIAYDAIGFGARTPPGAEPYAGAHDFYRRHPQWSFFGKMIWDFRQVVNYLETLPYVDRYRIGTMGHSHGAYGSIVCAAYEPRISAVVASCGFTTLRTDPTPQRWSHLTALLPRLGFYLAEIDATPIDWHEIVSCLAPRPYFHFQTLDDEVFPATANQVPMMAELRQVYGLYGCADWLRAQVVPGNHGIPRAVREAAYEWLSAVLPVRPDVGALRAQAPTSVAHWQAWRSMLLELVLRDIGPITPPALPATYETLSTAAGDGYERIEVRYLVAADEPVSAYLLMPTSSADQLPGMVVFHQTTAAGKREPVGLEGQESLFFAAELARHGYVVLVPDSITAGERVVGGAPFETSAVYQRYPRFSALGKMIQDGRRAIDILQAVPRVDRARIGVMGHSLGAEEALFVAALDDRVQAAVASCGFAPLGVEQNVERWARDHWFSYLPRLRVDLRAGRPPAWDFDLVVRLVAPRGYFHYQTSADTIFPEAAAAQPMVESTRAVWRLYQANDRLHCLLEPGGHDMPREARQAAYRWLDQVMGLAGAGKR
ncbi:MAG: hypothetical protein A2W31_04260 [Planctomycetes bacterium RBG_16_64_10]|nr:MAG: hypothetical protein A2W31_04260 [Planctomycetes bacterium RBG_16_64_10]